MAYLFESPPGPKRVSNIRVNTSTQGDNICVSMGRNRVAQALLFVSSPVEIKVNQGGGKGGGKSVTGYDVYADVQACIGHGPVTGIGSVWQGSSWLRYQGGAESITIVQNYTPVNAAVLSADNGVGLAQAYSASYNDYGQPNPTVLSGTDYVPEVAVPYDTTQSVAANVALLQSGQYNPPTDPTQPGNPPVNIGTFTLTAAADHSGGNTTYTGNFSSQSTTNSLVGMCFTVAGFVTHVVNNGTWICTANTSTTITLANAVGVAETHFATAKDVGGTYHFPSSDTGNVAIVNYMFNYALTNVQVTGIVLSGNNPVTGTPNTIVVNQQYTPTFDNGVVYYGDGDSQPNGTPFKLNSYTVGGTPPPAGTYNVRLAPSSGNVTAYQFATGDIGQEVLIDYGQTNQSVVQTDAPQLLNFELIGGTLRQAPWTFLETGGTVNDGNGSSVTMPPFPNESLGYTGLATVNYGPMFCGQMGEIQSNTFETFTPDSFGGGVIDCNPVQCVKQVLTNQQWGLGKTSGQGQGQPFPTDAIDNSSLGTWGTGYANPSATRIVANTATAWCAANNLFFSPLLDGQDSAASHIAKWLEAANIGAYVSEGLLKLSAYGSTSVAANGYTWTGPTTWVVALDDSSFMPGNEGEEPLKIERTITLDAFNKVQIAWEDALAQYADELTEAWDQSAINQYGERIEDPQDYQFIHTLVCANTVASLRCKRNIYIRLTVTGTLPYAYGYLEPMDIVTISTSSLWSAGANNINLGVANMPFRVIKTVNHPTKGIEVTFEQYNALAHEPVIFNKTTSIANELVNRLTPPGNTQAILFEAPSFMATALGPNVVGNQIWMGMLGQNEQYGGTNVWVSSDGGTKYAQPFDQVTSKARLGVLGATFPSGSAVDTVNSLVLDLAETSAPLEAGTSTDADNHLTLLFVDGEIVAHSSATTTGVGQQTLDTYILRGLYGSTIRSHAANALVLRLDDAIIKYTYPPQWKGKTLLFKFQSVNIYNLAAQPLANLTPVSFTLPGANPGTVDSSTQILVSQLNNNPVQAQGYFPNGSPLYQPSTTSPVIDILPCSIRWGTNVLDYGGGSVNPGVYSQQNTFTITGISTSGTSMTLTGSWVANPAYVGQYFNVQGFTGPRVPNNGTFLCTAQAAGSITLTNATLYAMTPLNVTISSVSHGGINLQMNGSFPSGGSNAYAGFIFYLGGTGVLNAGNNYAICTASTTTSITCNVYNYQSWTGTKTVSESMQADYFNVKATNGLYSATDPTGAIFVYADDPTFTGGSVTFNWTTNLNLLAADDKRIYFGSIVTVYKAAFRIGSIGPAKPVL